MEAAVLWGGEMLPVDYIKGSGLRHVYVGECHPRSMPSKEWRSTHSRADRAKFSRPADVAAKTGKAELPLPPPIDRRVLKCGLACLRQANAARQPDRPSTGMRVSAYSSRS